MALKKYIVDLLQDNPLNGISTYNDVLTLSTGAISRKIKKMVLTGEETFSKNTDDITDYNYWLSIPDNGLTQRVICTHVGYISGIPSGGTIGVTTRINTHIMYINFGADIMNAQRSGNTVNGFKEYLATQYTNGTPVTIWYARATETTEQITVPTGLSGTVDGYTTQTGTPTPINPIYPIANTVTMWANYTPSQYNGIAFVTATGQPEQYNGGWS